MSCHSPNLQRLVDRGDWAAREELENQLEVALLHGDDEYAAQVDHAMRALLDRWDSYIFDEDDIVDVIPQAVYL